MGTFGQIAYEAYIGCGAVSPRMPEPWDSLPQEYRDSWEAAGQAVAEHIEGGEDDG